MSKDLVCGSVTLALAIVYYVLADAIPRSLLSDGVGPGGLPKAYAIGLAVLSAILIVRALRERRLAAAAAPADPEVKAAQRLAVRRAAGLLAIGALYVAALPYLGYVLSLALLLGATTYYQGGALTRRVGIVAVCGAVFFWLLFVWLLHIPQPAGFWPELF
jgi:hypothetical protein